jgi:hypothetical protein
VLIAQTADADALVTARLDEEVLAVHSARV